jgi:chemosensory pili system protein ChpC
MSQAVLVQESPDSLVGLIVPLHERKLLLPNVAVAELVPYRTPTAVTGLPHWVLGELPWRELRLPLLSFEAASGGPVELGVTPRIAVLNAISGRLSTRFIALLVQGIPRSYRLSADLPAAEVTLGPLELAAVTLEDEVLRIPDLQALEHLLADAGLR